MRLLQPLLFSLNCSLVIFPIVAFARQRVSNALLGSSVFADRSLALTPLTLPFVMLRHYMAFMSIM
ncbi:hypothetical protein K474DRAFT_1657699 [Panus rudis PR-1116 ss-1]|nr:hypothetical protein K474DRAFT_1657699 [Panus rudis PR-1116 ss-1]